MEIIDTLKIIWRNILATHEAKLTFFHRNEKLVNSKKYDYLFRASYKQGVEVLFFDTERELIWLKKDGITIVTNNDYGIFLEILVDKTYQLPPQLNGDFCVFDVGMNRGYASLFFAGIPNCKKIIGFELQKDIFDYAIRNFDCNKTLAEKITPYNFGLYNVNDEINVCECEVDGNTGIESCIESQSYLSKKMQTKKLKKISKATVKKSSEVFAQMLTTIEPTDKKVLKIDIEGAEYAVFEDLYNNNLLQQFDVIIGECHNGIKDLEKYLDDFVCVNKSLLSELVVNFCYINKRITN